MFKYIILLLIVIGEVFASPLGGLPTGFNDSSTEQQNQPKRYADILSFLDLESEKGNGEYSFYLANFYLNGSYEKDADGKVVEKNTDLAIKYFKKSIDSNFIYSAITLGSLYLYHEDLIKTPNNVDTAEFYLNKAISMEVYEAYTILGDIYFNYKGDAKKAIEYFFLGASQNISTSQYALAVIHNTGYKDDKFELEKSELLSIKYLTDACLNPKKTKKIESLCYNSSIIKKEKVGE